MRVQLIEKSGQADGNADARQFRFGVMAGKIVIAPAGTNAAEFGMRVDQRLINRAGVVIEAARDGQIKPRAIFRHTKAFSDHHLRYFIQPCWKTGSVRLSACNAIRTSSLVPSS